jgi:hypothetical protein
MEHVVPSPVATTPPAEAQTISGLDAVWTEGGDVRAALTRALTASGDRAALVEAALERLADPTFGRELLEGRTRRSVYVEAVLAAGYPWALQLEPADVTEARELEQAIARGKRAPFYRAAIAGISLGLLAGLAFAAWAAGWPEPTPPQPVIAPAETLRLPQPRLDPKRPRAEPVVPSPQPNDDP